MTAPPRDDSSWPPPHLLDPERLAAVEVTGLLEGGRLDMGLLDSAAAHSWDRLTGLAARLLHAPMAFLTLVDDKQSNWLSCVGVDEAAGRSNAVEAAGRSNAVEESFCQYVIADRAPFVVGDAAAHTRTRDNPSVDCWECAHGRAFSLRTPAVSRWDRSA